MVGAAEAAGRARARGCSGRGRSRTQERWGGARSLAQSMCSQCALGCGLPPAPCLFHTACPTTRNTAAQRRRSLPGPLAVLLQPWRRVLHSRLLRCGTEHRQSASLCSSWPTLPRSIRVCLRAPSALMPHPVHCTAGQTRQGLASWKAGKAGKAGKAAAGAALACERPPPRSLGRRMPGKSARLRRTILAISWPSPHATPSSLVALGGGQTPYISSGSASATAAAGRTPAICGRIGALV